MRRLWSFLLLTAMLLCLVPSLAACNDTGEFDLIQTKTLTWAVGAPLPEASDFVTYMPDGVTVAFAEEYEYPQLGEYTVRLIFTDKRGKTAEREAKMHLVLDSEPPKIVGVKDISIYVGDGVSYRSGISLTDNCDGAVRLEINSDAVNTAIEGGYSVIYTATDAAGNVTQKTVTVYVYNERVTEEMLWAQIDRLISERISKNTTTEQQVREVYRYVYYSIAYTDSSDKSDWVRAAYEGIRTGQGDCYTYFALSKAFFVRLGIENKDVQRTEGIVTERHYWNMVNIGSEASPRWYHFDACRIRGVSAPFGCLLTDAQIDAFSRYKVDGDGVSNYFYAYDRTKYPMTDVTVITSTAFD